METPFCVALLLGVYSGGLLVILRAFIRGFLVTEFIADGEIIELTDILQYSYTYDVVIIGFGTAFVTMGMIYAMRSMTGVWAAVVITGPLSLTLDLVKMAIIGSPHSAALGRFYFTQSLMVVALGSGVLLMDLGIMRLMEKLPFLNHMFIVCGLREAGDNLGVMFGILVHGIFFMMSTFLAIYGAFVDAAKIYDMVAIPYPEKSDWPYLIAAASTLLIEDAFFHLFWRWWRREHHILNLHVGMLLSSCMESQDITVATHQLNIFSSKHELLVSTIGKQIRAITVGGAIRALIVLIVGGIRAGTVNPIPDCAGAVLTSALSFFTFIQVTRADRAPWRLCPRYRRCASFLNKCSIPPALLDDRYNRCYCSQCNNLTGLAGRQVFWRGEPARPFTLPAGWARFGVKVDPAFQESHGVFEQWNQCYHGTAWTSLASILSHHQLLLPGDVLLDGTKLRIREGHLEDQLYAYTTPTVRYASRNYYATPCTLPDGSLVRVVLECRQHPRSVNVGPETIGWKKSHPEESLDPHIPDDELEWFTNRRVAIIITGILVRFDDGDEEDSRGDARPPTPPSADLIPADPEVRAHAVSASDKLASEQELVDFVMPNPETLYQTQ